METQDHDNEKPPQYQANLVELERARLELERFVAPVCHLGTQAQLIKLYGALAKAQGEFEPITKNRTAEIPYKDKSSGALLGSYTMRYADLEEITAKTRPALSRNGLATLQIVGPAKIGGGLALFTQLIHEGGGTLMSEIGLPIDLRNGGNIKDMGALITYLRRYAKGALLDVAADDDLDQQFDFDQAPEPVTPRAGQVTRQPAEPQVTGRQTAAQGEFYTQEQFDKNLPDYIAAMQQGKSADYIIKVSSTKRKMTPEMMQAIRDNEPTQEQDA